MAPSYKSYMLHSLIVFTIIECIVNLNGKLIPKEDIFIEMTNGAFVLERTKEPTGVEFRVFMPPFVSDTFLPKCGFFTLNFMLNENCPLSIHVAYQHTKKNYMIQFYEDTGDDSGEELKTFVISNYFDVHLNENESSISHGDDRVMFNYDCQLAKQNQIHFGYRVTPNDSKCGLRLQLLNGKYMAESVDTTVMPTTTVKILPINLLTTSYQDYPLVTRTNYDDSKPFSIGWILFIAFGILFFVIITSIVVIVLLRRRLHNKRKMAKKSDDSRIESAKVQSIQNRSKDKAENPN